MPSITITDGLTLTIDAQLAPASTWLKYAAQLPGLLLKGDGLTQLPNLSLNDPAISSLQPALSFQKPVSLGTGGAELILGAEAGGSFHVISRTPDCTALFQGDDYGETVEIPADECYVAIQFGASVNAGVQDTAGSITFGMDATTGISLESYRPFATGPGAIGLVQSLALSIGEFVIPADAADLRALAPGVIVTITGHGSLKFSGTVNLLAIANPLATLALPSPAPSLAIVQTGSVTVGAAWELSTAYQVRAQKVDDNHVRLGWYRKRDSDFTVSAAASAGISAGTAGTDLFHSVIAAISSSAQADAEQLNAAGLPADQRVGIEAVVKSAVNRNLELAVSAEIGSLAEQEAAFLYEVDLAALDQAAEQALRSALRGDLTALAGSATPVAGITEVRSILSRVRSTHVSFKVNLLGVFNFASVSELALRGTVTFTPSTGELVIADQATASRIQTAAINFGADEDKLRHVMAESFLLTAAYRGGRSLVAMPELTSAHVFFRLDNRAGRDEMRAFAAVAAALGSGEPHLPDGVADFGRTCFAAEASYDEAAARALFLTPDGAPRNYIEYEAAGRQAIALLVLPDADDAFRLRPATDDQLWSRMSTAGPANFGSLFPQPIQAAVVEADYVTIEWWADAMRSTAEILAQIDGMAGPAGTAPDNPAFESLRQKLASHLLEVAATARQEFGSPWGLLAMFLASGKKARAEVHITGPRFVFAAQPALAAGS